MEHMYAVRESTTKAIYSPVGALLPIPYYFRYKFDDLVSLEASTISGQYKNAVSRFDEFNALIYFLARRKKCPRFGRVPTNLYLVHSFFIRGSTWNAVGPQNSLYQDIIYNDRDRFLWDVRLKIGYD